MASERVAQDTESVAQDTESVAQDTESVAQDTESFAQDTESFAQDAVYVLRREHVSLCCESENDARSLWFFGDLGSAVAALRCYFDTQEGQGDRALKSVTKYADDVFCGGLMVEAAYRNGDTTRLWIDEVKQYR